MKVALKVILFVVYSSLEIMRCRSIDVPVFFVIFGEIPLYLRMNIELTSRKNPVVVISDLILEKNATARGDLKYPVVYDALQNYSKTARKFAQLYVHFCHDRSNKRRIHELQCIQRWLVLDEYATVNNISALYFSDGDSFLFVNAKDAFLQREECHAVINVEAQSSNLHWVAAGEASLWTIDALHDFTLFLFELYTNRKDIFLKKLTNKSCVVDMTILWLWYYRS